MALANITNNILTDSGILVTNLTPTSRTITINGVTYDLSADRSWTIATGVGGSGTTNYLPKFTGTSTIGNSLVYDNGTNVAIGATSGLSSKLTVIRTGAGIQDLLILDNLNYSVGVLDGVRFNLRGFNFEASSTYGSADNKLTIGIGTQKDIVLTQSGNLGLGVTPSAWASGLSVFQGSSSLSVGNSGNGGMNVLANAYYGSNWTYVSSAQASWYQQIDGKHAWYNAPSGTAGNAISFTQAMTLNASGNLSIGNTNDTYKLDVSGASRILASTYTAGAILYLRDAAATGSNTTFGGLFLGSSPGTDFVLGKQSTNAVGSFAIKTGGGTTLFTLADTGAATFSSSVEIGQSATVRGFTGTTGAGMFMAYGSAGAGIGSIYSYNYGTSTYGGTVIDGSYVAFYNSGSEKMRVTGGNVGIGTTAPNSLLEVNRTITFSSIDTYGQLVVKTTSGANGRLLNIGVDETNGVSFIQSLNRGTDAMPLSLQRYGGAVLIGTTTEGFLGKLQVAGSVAITGQYNTVLPSSSFSYFDGSGQVVSSSSNASALYLDTTWNTTGNPDGIYLNVTNTASGASSKLLNLKVGSVSQFSVSKAGAITTSAPTNGTAQPWKLGNAVSGSLSTNHYIIVEINGTTYSIPALQGLP